jgi:hypothetical protein
MRRVAFAIVGTLPLVSLFAPQRVHVLKAFRGCCLHEFAGAQFQDSPSPSYRLHGGKMTSKIRARVRVLFFLSLMTPSLAIAGQVQIAPGGVYSGSYVCNQRQISLQLFLEPKGAAQLSGLFTFYTPGSDPLQPIAPSGWLAHSNPRRVSFASNQLHGSRLRQVT